MCCHHIKSEPRTQTFTLHSRPLPLCVAEYVKLTPHWQLDERAHKRRFCRAIWLTFVCDHGRSYIFLYMKMSPGRSFCVLGSDLMWLQHILMSNSWPSRCPSCDQTLLPCWKVWTWCFWQEVSRGGWGLVPRRDFFSYYGWY